MLIKEIVVLEWPIASQKYRSYSMCMPVIKAVNSSAVVFLSCTCAPHVNRAATSQHHWVLFVHLFVKKRLTESLAVRHEA